MAWFATPFIARCPGPPPIAVTAGLLEDTAALKWRQAEIWERIKEATGAVESDSDHVDDWLDYDDHLQLDETSYIALEG